METVGLMVVIVAKILSDIHLVRDLKKAIEGRLDNHEKRLDEHEKLLAK